MKQAITSHGVSFKFLHTEEPFLKDLHLEVEKGECVLICGGSGSGKTSFSRLLNGISPQYIEGELTGHLQTLHLNAETSDIEEYVPIVGSVFQNPKTQHFTVNTTSELAFPLENMGFDPDDIRKKIIQKTKTFEIEHLLDRDIFQLSGGEKQQIAFVTANMLEPSVLILDEVTSNLDQEAIARIRIMVQLLKARGVTIIILEHRLAWTKDLVDRYILFEQGTIKKQWAAADFIQLSNEELYQMGLRSLDLSNHREKIQAKKSTSTSTSNGLLQTKNLTIGYGKKKVLEDLHLSFYPGQVTGLMGANGRGKSTLANTLTGFQSSLAGEIYWAGQKMTAKQLLQKSYLVMQDMNYQLFSDSVEDEILLGAQTPEAAEEVMATLNLSFYKERHPMSLSEGQKQRVAIASALLSGKEIIIFDEPTSGLDYEHMERFGRLLQYLKETKAIILVITHDEELAAKWFDSIIELKPDIE
jgi:energy-coupling factor transport system ATP-binding protein